MYEQLIERLVKKDVSAIAGDVIDDSEDIVIPVSGVPPPPPEEFPWLIVAIVAGVSIIGAVAFAMFKK